MPLCGPLSEPLSSGGPTEVTPDVVFVISTQPDGSNPLGYFCSTANNPLSLSWFVFSPNSDTWLWLTNGPPPPPPAPAPTQLGDAAWPSTFYLCVPSAAPPSPAYGFTATGYSRPSSWSGLGVPQAVPTWLLTNNKPNGEVAVGYVQLVGAVRTWYKSGSPGSTWPGNTIEVTSWLKLSPPGLGNPGGQQRVSMATAKLA